MHGRGRGLLALCVVATLAAGFGAARARAAELDGPEDFALLAWHGFLDGVDGHHPEGSLKNAYSWSGAWFRGGLYIGTGKNLNCFRSGAGAAGCPAGGVPGEEERAQIWQYTPGGSGGAQGRWALVYRSPFAAGTVPRDVGYRGMAVCDAGGPPALFAGAVGVGGHIVFSRDGRRWATASNVGLHNSIGELIAGTADSGFRAMTCWHGRLLAAPAASSIDGDVPYHPVLLGNTDPADPESPWETVVDVAREPGVGDPNDVAVFSMEKTREALYLGVSNAFTGFEVWKGTGCADPSKPCRFTWRKLVTRAAGRPNSPDAKLDGSGVTDMQAFGGAVYLGASSSSSFHSAPAELVRVNADDTFDLVVGYPRLRSTMPSNFNCRPAAADPALCVPIADIGAGFGGGAPAFRPGTAGYIWRLEAFGGALYAGTAEATGFGLFRTRDGEHWETLTHTGFGVPGSFGVRTLVGAPRWPGGPALVIGTVGGNTDGLNVLAGTCSAQAPPLSVPDVELPEAGPVDPGARLAVDRDGDGVVHVTLDGGRSGARYCGSLAGYDWYAGDVTGRSLSGLAPLGRDASLGVDLATGQDATDHTFTLRVVDASGREDRRAITIRASRDAPPVATITTPAGGSVEARDFDGDGTALFELRGTCADPEAHLVSCAWSATGGVTIQDRGDGTATAYVPISAGRASASLVAVDDHGYRAVARVGVRARAVEHDAAVGPMTVGAGAQGVRRPVVVRVRNDGDVAEPVVVSLTDSGGGSVDPAEQAVTIPRGASVDLTFWWTPAAAGGLTLTATVEVPAGDSLRLDNRRGIRVDVPPAAG